MFRGLRLRLTLLYLLAALALIALVGAGTYGLLDTYFRSTTDQALQYRMAQEFERLGAPLPPELATAAAAWDANHPQPIATPTAVPHDAEQGDDHEGGRRAAGSSQANKDIADDAYDGELAAVFVQPLNVSGQPLIAPGGSASSIVPDQQAVSAALVQGRDWRTMYGASGARVRLLTYRIEQGGATVMLQAGRTLADQDRVLRRLLLGLLGLGGLSAVALTASSWWLAGRSLRPAQLAWERQQTFVANASHELRAPLTLLRASAEVAQRGLPAGDADRRALLDDVLHETDHMSRLVEDLLLLSRLDAHQIKVERQRIALPDLLADVQRQIGRVADDRGVGLNTSGAAGTVEGDPLRIRQVLLILLDNALRHTPRGGTIRIETRHYGHAVDIAVVDTGSGIAPEHLPHIFERFYRGDSTRTNESSGSGLGLSIARALVEAQHGHIAIASQPGQGTRITVTLPAPEGEALKRSSAQAL